MNIAITGGSGFIGSRLALACRARGDAVTVLGQENTQAEIENSRELVSSGVRVLRASVTEREELNKAFQSTDAVVHLAATQHEANVPDQRFVDVNVTGTQHVMQASIKAGVKRVVHGSSIGVYGNVLKGVLSEQSTPAPDNIYGRTKLEGERQALAMCDKLEVVVVRISETYGPGDRRLVKLFKAIDKGVFFRIGKGTNLHHLIYIDDLIDGLLLAATAREAAGKVFVLSGKRAVTTDEMVDAIAAVLGKVVPQRHAPLWAFMALAFALERVLGRLGIQPPLHRRRMDFFRKHFEFDQTIPRRVLGFHPKVDLQDGIRETAAWYRQRNLI